MSAIDRLTASTVPREKRTKRRRKPIANVTSSIRQDFLGGIDMTARVNRGELSQWFTDPGLARRVASFASTFLEHGMTVLEPSAGDGALIEALLEIDRGPEGGSFCGKALCIDAVELDPFYAARLRERYRAQASRSDDVPFSAIVVHEGDYLVRPAPDVLYDATIQNPPYENGLDGLFVEKSMQESERVLAILRLVAMVGKDRCERIWSKLDPGGPWVMPALALCKRRPDFVGSGMVQASQADENGGAKADFCVPYMRRRRPEDPESVPTQIAWW